MVATKINSDVEDSFDCVSHNGDLLVNLNIQRQSKILCDVILLIGDDELPAHKGVLAANSKYFFTMFTAEMAERTMEKIRIFGISTSAMKQVLDFMYTGIVNVTEANVKELLGASSFLLVQKVQKLCSEFLQNILVSKNCLAILSIADELYCEALYRSCVIFLCQNFVEVSQTDDFARLDSESVKKMLLSDDLNIEKEEDLIDVVINWIKHDVENRKQLLPALLRSIRMKFIQKPLDVLYTLFKELQYNSTNEIIKSCITLSSDVPRKSYSTLEVIISVGGCSKSSILKQTFCYIPGRDKWTALGELHAPRWRLGLVRSKGNIYAVGGISEVVNPHGDPPFIEQYNPPTDSWQTVKLEQPFSVDRDHYGTAVLSGCLLLIGGVDSVSEWAKRDVIKVDLGNTSQPLTNLSPMVVPRAGHCVVTSERFVYVIGGAQTQNIEVPLGMNTVERYNPGEDSWDFMTSMTNNRCYAVAAWCEGKLYVIGGCDGSSVLSCGEMFDPDLNFWRPIPSMNTPRMKSGIAVYHGQIYVFGGVCDLRQTILRSVECYNPSGKCWTFVSPLPTESFDLQCCALEIPYKNVASVMIDE